jgi:hypothetical protein
VIGPGALLALLSLAALIAEARLPSALPRELLAVPPADEAVSA